MSTLGLDLDVTAAGRGDREAFARLVDATRSLVSSIALAIVRDIPASEDVSQDVYLSTWRGLGKLRQASSFLPWLRELTRNRALQEVRSRSRRHLRIQAASPELLAAAADPRPDASGLLLADEERRLLAEAIEALPDDTRDVVILYYREGRSAAQVADLLGLGEAAVRKRLERARTRLRAEWLERAGAALEKSAPGTAFTSVVIAALAVGVPGTAAAGGTVLASASGGAKLLPKIALLGGGALAGAIGGVAGVFLGVARLKRRARDDEERRALDRFALGGAAVVAAACAGFPIAALVSSSPWSPLVTFVLFLAALAALHVFWLPRIVRRRHEAEMREDPERALRLRRRERAEAVLGWSLGILCGGAGVLLGVWLRLRG